MRHLALVGVVVGAAILVAVPSLADWPTHPATNLDVCRALDLQFELTTCTDGAGGAILGWTDYRPGAPGIYVARVLQDGTLPWAFWGQGIAVDAAGLAMESDGAGGALLAWTSWTSPNNIHAQRIDATGAGMWGSSGVLIETTRQGSPRVIHDGQQGMIVVWSTCKFCLTSDVLVQRFDANGNPLWLPGGVVVCAGTSSSDDTGLAPDGAGGAFVTWQDRRDGPPDVYVQHISPDGSISWAANGVPVDVDPASFVYKPRLLADGDGDVFVSYVKNIDVNYMYVQHLSAAGTRLWGANGVSVTPGRNSGRGRMLSDGMGGLLLGLDGSGEDYYSSISDVWVQRIAANGSRAWGTAGISICTDPSTQHRTQFVGDGTGGAYLVWMDWRAGTGKAPDIYGQRIDVTGTALWSANGLAIATASGQQWDPDVVLAGQAGMVVAWEDERVPANDFDIYAQLVAMNGNLGLSPSDAAEWQAQPAVALEIENPVRRASQAMIRLAARSPVTLRVHDVSGRTVLARPYDALAPGLHAIPLNFDVPTGLYFVTVSIPAAAATRKVMVVR